MNIALANVRATSENQISGRHFRGRHENPSDDEDDERSKESRNSCHQRDHDREGPTFEKDLCVFARRSSPTHSFDEREVNRPGRTLFRSAALVAAQRFDVEVGPVERSTARLRF